MNLDGGNIPYVLYERMNVPGDDERTMVVHMRIVLGRVDRCCARSTR